MTIKPGGETTLRIDTAMHEGMDGPHVFQITVKTNDRVEPQKILTVKGNFGKF